MHSFGKTPKFRTAKFGLKTTDIILRCKSDFDMLNRLGVTHACDRQMDRRREMTDIIVTNAMLQYSFQAGI